MTFEAGVQKRDGWGCCCRPDLTAGWYGADRGVMGHQDIIAALTWLGGSADARPCKPIAA